MDGLSALVYKIDEVQAGECKRILCAAGKGSWLPSAKGIECEFDEVVSMNGHFIPFYLCAKEGNGLSMFVFHLSLIIRSHGLSP